MDELTSFADLSVLNDDETVSIKFFRLLLLQLLFGHFDQQGNKWLNIIGRVKTIMQVWVVG